MHNLNFDNVSGLAIRPHISIPDTAGRWWPDAVEQLGEFGDFDMAARTMVRPRLWRLRNVYGVPRTSRRMLIHQFQPLLVDERIVMVRLSMCAYNSINKEWTTYTDRNPLFGGVRIPVPIQQIITTLEADGVFESLIVIMTDPDGDRYALFGLIGRKPHLIVEWATQQNGLARQIDDVVAALRKKARQQHEARKEELAQQLRDAVERGDFRKFKRRVRRTVSVVLKGSLITIPGIVLMHANSWLAEPVVTYADLGAGACILGIGVMASSMFVWRR